MRDINFKDKQLGQTLKNGSEGEDFDTKKAESGYWMLS